ncbi:conserved hypothetical protein, membrane [Candidatus Thiomargarita nelsonii]|uniref:DUF3592 domain-containing protein n=1 Tax=Candidatus Thiomargarita nelsonii TaxID=1003181 RepID=A0A176S418_9GAMM|nr:conserved hypothetical protein, membrane [Candidatus Thiomargarita nelsonii]
MNIAINRNIPIIIKCNLVFGGILSQFGWFFFGFGLILFWVFAMNADLSFLHFTGKITTITTGIATDSFKTGASENQISIFENHYKFTTREGRHFEGFSYSTGGDIPIGTILTVEYPEGKPQYSRIKGMRRQIFGLGALFVVIFPLIGLALMFPGIKRGTRSIKLLKNGELTKGQFVSMVPTNITFNEQTLYKFTFRFKDNLGNEFFISEIDVPYQKEKSILYLKNNPNYAIMLDSSTLSLSINEEGKIEFSSPVEPFYLMIIPLLTLVGHGSYIVIKFII